MAQELLSLQGLRIDGRRQNELRQIQCRLGVLERCDGSAYMLHGNTKVIASISGPKHPTKNSANKNRGGDEFIFNVRVKFATFSKNGERQKVVKNSKKLGEIEINLKNIFKSVILVEKYEKSQLDLNIEILQTDGSEICTVVNAATLALIDAGICMKEYICACTASLTNDGVALLDVSHLEEICGGPTLTIAALPRTGDHEQSVAYVELSQKFYLKDLNKIFDCALMGCEKIRGILDEAIRSNAFELVNSELTNN
ncbi:hypothetical protein PVAND_003582 [Polypedilum vanderplanki]|uniref:Putative exosome complex component RRP41 n=1 Tax=Polypedilum vanderplanki TaxID=319348 RepID=A0A9J6BWA1_POLVA|nr:hypothetical protein PVAND_003582 [Polypedilum vanderplanki]